ncbi:hypothetical protein ACQ33O_09210 [Ferruginibacter sp. SUN002]|uniref:hypothetical protein n=1 Tax=Ferruginibacter sp. SUN002 TaxID=2937789 RepID=UPI003D360EEE
MESPIELEPHMCSLFFYPVVKNADKYYVHASVTSNGYFDNMYGIDYTVVLNKNFNIVYFRAGEVFY